MFWPRGERTRVWRRKSASSADIVLSKPALRNQVMPQRLDQIAQFGARGEREKIVGHRYQLKLRRTPHGARRVRARVDSLGFSDRPRAHLERCLALGGRVVRRFDQVVPWNLALRPKVRVSLHRICARRAERQTVLYSDALLSQSAMSRALTRSPMRSGRAGWKSYKAGSRRAGLKRISFLRKGAISD